MEEKKINGRKHIKIKCSHTGEFFWKDKSEYTRRIKQNPNYSFYVNAKAKAAAAGENGYIHLKPWMGVATNNFIYSKNKGVRDGFSPFRYFIRAAKKAKRDKPNVLKFQKFDITLEFLLDLWNKQKGVCPYSKLEMELPPTLNHNRKDPLCASLDRINPDVGYMQNNVQFVTQFVNLGKNTFSSETIFKYFNSVRNAKK